MTANPNAPYFVLSAVKRIYPQLPQLIGAEEWVKIQPQIDTNIMSLEAQPTAYLASTQLFGLLAYYEPARQRLSDELTIQAVVAANLSSLLSEMQFVLDDAALAAMMSGLVWDVDAATIPTPEESEKETRAITMKDGGAAGANSIKFKNLELDLGKMLTIGGGFLLVGHDMLDKLTPFAVVGGILVMIGALLHEMTIKIEQQEATVFWGFIVATQERPKDRQSSDEALFTTTNVERHKRGLPDLTDEQFKHSLYKLEQLGSIARVDEDTYLIVERFRVR